MKKFANIALPVPLRKEFTYTIPDSIDQSDLTGKRAVVSFSGRKIQGYITSVTDLSDAENHLDIIAVTDPEPVFSQEMLKFCRWVSDYYLCGLGEVLKIALPPVMSSKGRKTYSFVPGKDIETLTKKEEIEAAGFASAFSPFSKSDFDKAFGKNSVKLLSALKKQGIIEESYENKELTKSRSSKKTCKNVTLSDPDNFRLNSEQQKCCEEILSASASKKHSAFLLHGVTGSGKTMVYIAVVSEMIRSGKTALMLVPEISLTGQTVSSFRKYLGDKIALLHSRMSDRERFNVWNDLKEGKYSVVIGPRSAIFAPLKNIGVIIVDEEHDQSYKQSEKRPRYCARNSAVMRGYIENIPVVLGSATPSAESWHNAVSGKYRLLELTRRHGGAVMPEMIIVKKITPGTLIEPASLKILSGELSQGRKAMVLLNRRGYAPRLVCNSCGYTAECKNCSVPMTFHLSKKQLICHHCGYYEKGRDLCDECGGENISFFGAGVEQAEAELKRLFPSVPVIRMDYDTTRKKDGHRIILESFAEEGAAILVGTKMIAKGHDFHDVSAVCVLSLDGEMTFPDFRSDERAFQLLEQVSGRAGRRSIKGVVAVQTFDPENRIVQHAKSHDYKKFITEELAVRELTSYPPFASLVKITMSSKKQGELKAYSEKLYEELISGSEGCIIYRPVEKMIHKVDNRFRLYILIKSVIITGREKRRAAGLIGRVLEKIPASSSVRTETDVDPSDIM